MLKMLRKVGFQICWQSSAIVVLSIVLTMLINHFRPDHKMPLIGDWSPKNRLITDAGKNIVISLKEAQNLFLSGQAIFLDARPDSEFQTGHIQGAYNLPWQKFNDYIGDMMEKLSEEKTIITYCDGESCDLSKDLAKELINMGYIKIRVLVNGWSLWSESRLPVEK